MDLMSSDAEKVILMEDLKDEEICVDAMNEADAFDDEVMFIEEDELHVDEYDADDEEELYLEDKEMQTKVEEDGYMEYPADAFFAEDPELSVDDLNLKEECVYIDDPEEVFFVDSDDQDDEDEQVRLYQRAFNLTPPESQENQWIPVGSSVSLPSCSLVRCPETVTEDVDEVDGDMVATTSEPVAVHSFEKFRSLDFQLRFQNVFSTPHTSIKSPLPSFNWANSGDVWKNMLLKEEKFRRDPGLFRNHPELQPRMRSILLDWLSEVCEVYRLHKETFTLAVDYLDRYLSVVSNIPKTQLQLLGISSLFIAAKLEEIYPPKLSEFAYVTDSACTETDIVRQEMIMLKALKWDLSPMTTNAWLGVYLQVANIDHIADPELGFVFPQFSTHAFVQISRLCDLSLMDIGSLKFYRNVIAAAALYHHTNEKLVMEVSGLNWADLYPCVKWMNPFAKAILEVGQSPIKFFPQINPEDCHNIQTHNVDMVLMDRAFIHQANMEEREKLYPSTLDLSAQLVGLLTPPSNRKPQSRTQPSSSSGSNS